MTRRDFLKICATAAMGAVATRAAAQSSQDGTVYLTIKGSRLTPDKVTVKKGQPIAIVDHDNTHHSIYSETPGMELQCPINPGGTGIIKLNIAGKATIECAEHPTEVGIITVV
jgi:plastocyanin